MNERIRELIKQHGINITIDEMGYGEGDIEGLVELLVRECARSVTWYTKQELAGVNRNQVFRANKTVLEHFGVKE